MADEQAADGELADSAAVEIMEMLEDTHITPSDSRVETTSSQPETAASRTFAITELFEQILLDLNFVERLAVIRVCKRWKNVVETSSALAPSQNMFLVKPEPDADPISLGELPSEIDRSRELRRLTVKPNPLLFKISDTLLDMTEEQFEKYRRPEASWWTMQLCYPPVLHGYKTSYFVGVTLADELLRKVLHWDELRRGEHRGRPQVSGHAGAGWGWNGGNPGEDWDAVQWKGRFTQ